MLVDLLLNLLLPLVDQPLDEASVVLLSVDHVLLLGQHRTRAELFLFIVNNSMQLTIFDCVARSRLLIEWLLDRRQCAGQSSIDIKLLPG